MLQRRSSCVQTLTGAARLNLSDPLTIRLPAASFSVVVAQYGISDPLRTSDATPNPTNTERKRPSAAGSTLRIPRRSSIPLGPACQSTDPRGDVAGRRAVPERAALRAPGARG